MGVLRPLLKYFAVCFQSQQVHVWPQQLPKSRVVLVAKMKSGGEAEGQLGFKAQENPVSRSATEPWADTSVWGSLSP